MTDRLPKQKSRGPISGMVRTVCVCALVGTCLVSYAFALERETIKLALSEATAAVRDDLPKLAEKQLLPLLTQENRGDLTSEEAGQAAMLFARALDAQRKYEELIQLFCGADPWYSELGEKAPLSFWCALAHYRVGAHEKALAELTTFENRPFDSDYIARAIRLRALCRLKAEDVEGAVTDFAQFAQKYPTHPELEVCLLDWGKSLINVDRFGEARTVLRQLVARPTNSRTVADGRYWMGCALERDGEAAQAAAMFAGIGSDTNVWADLRAKAWLAFAPLSQGSTTNSMRAVEALTEAINQAKTPALKQESGFVLGHLLLRLGRIDEGIVRLKELITEAPQDPRAEKAQLGLSVALLNDERYEDAATEFQHYLETYNDSRGQAEAYDGRGRALFGVGRFAEAAAAFEKAYGLYSEPTARERSLFKVADSYLANGQYQQGLDTYSKFIAEYEKSASVARAYLQSGVCLVGLGNTEEAGEVFERMVADYPGSELVEDAMLRLAQIRESKSQWLEAIAIYDRLMEAYPNGKLYVQALHGRGLARYRLYRFEDALQDFEEVVKGFADTEESEHAFFMRGMCLFGMWRDEQALAVCRDFLEQNPTSKWAPDVLFWLSKYEYNLGNYKESEEGFLSFVEAYPAHELADDCLLRAGQALAMRKEYRQAVEMLNRMFKEYPASPKNVEARFEQAEALRALAKYSSAILIYQEIISKHPESDLLSSAWGRKGDCEFTLGAEDPKRYEESMASYGVVVRSSSATPDLVLQAECKIGRCLEKLGRTEEAFEHYYLNVILRYFRDEERGVSHNEAAKAWFTRAAFNAADILEASVDWRRAARILEHVVKSGVPAADEAAERIRKLKAERWWLFY